jgi:sterol 24-C-methyltransferase
MNFRIDIIFAVILPFITLFYFFYNIITIDRINALKRLRNINKKSLEKYFKSYDKVYNDQTMVSTLEDFNNGLPPAKFTIPENDVKPSEYTADCYSILKDLCALGNLKKMYIPRCLDLKKSIPENQKLYEQQVGENLKVGVGSKILEIGSGCGRIAHEMSQFTGADVYGINIDYDQITDAKNYAKKTSNQKTHFLYSDLNDKQPFEDNYFDGIYVFQGCAAFISNHESFFKEMFRILKPGGIFFMGDVVLMDNFNKSKKFHLELLKNSRMVMAGGVFIHYKYFEKYASEAGFNILSSKGGTFPNLASELPLLVKEHDNFNSIEKIIKLFTNLNILPNYMPELMKRLRYGGDDLIIMEENNLITMNWDFYFQKPLN